MRKTKRKSESHTEPFKVTIFESLLMKRSETVIKLLTLYHLKFRYTNSPPFFEFEIMK